jgi:hypothetical protein
MQKPVWRAEGHTIRAPDTATGESFIASEDAWRQESRTSRIDGRKETHRVQVTPRNAPQRSVIGAAASGGRSIEVVGPHLFPTANDCVAFTSSSSFTVTIILDSLSDFV